jgi:hypothetical protein
VQIAVAAGVALVVAIAIVAATHAGAVRTESLQRNAASFLLLAGLAVAIVLGSAALNRDAETGRFGALIGGGASRPQLVAGAVGSRIAVLAGVIAVWGVALQIASVAVGLGPDGRLAVHTLAVAEGLLLTLLACAAASAIVGPVASGVFGAGVFVLAQAVVNLKAAADQNLIGTADGLVRALYYVSPRTIVSPMIADLQLRNAGGPAAPRLTINDNTVFVHASDWGSIVWTLVWCVVLGLLCAAGLRRRPIS